MGGNLLRSEIKQSAEAHGEIPMTMEQFQAEERRAKQDRLERGKEKYSLVLTADELDWLLFEIMEHAAFEAKAKGNGSQELEIRASIDEWLAQVTEQGYTP